MKRLSNILFVLLAFLVLEISCLVCLVAQPFSEQHEVDQTVFVSEVNDIPLLTEQEKEWARKSGVASYTLNGVHYIDLTLPSYYWDQDEEDRVINNAHAQELIERSLCEDHSRLEGDGNAN